MHALLRMSGVVLIGGLLTVIVFGMPYPCAPVRELLDISRHDQQLQHWREAIERYRENQYQAVREWIAQRCTLEETMQRFQELDREYAQAWPPFRDMVLQRLPMSDEERHYRLIAERLESILHGRPEEVNAILLRLTKEYQQLQANRPKLGNSATNRRERTESTVNEATGGASLD